MSMWMTTVGAVEQEPAWRLLDFPVKISPAHVIEGDKAVELVGVRAVFRPDRMEVLNTCGPDYRLVRHRDAFMAVHEWLVAHDQPIASVETAVGRDGARARVTWRFNNHALVGSDRLARTISAFNSYDGRYRIMAVCGGVLLGDGTDIRGDHPYSTRHEHDSSAKDIVDQARKALDDMGRTADWWAALDDVSTPRGLVELALAAEHVGVRAGKVVLERVLTTEQPTAWTVYKAMSWYATHRVRVRADRRLLDRQEFYHAAARGLMGRLV